MGKLTNLNPPAPITDADIPGTIARDTETAAAINTHTSATDPHAQYLLLSEGDERYRRNSTAFFTSAAFPPSSTAGNSIAFSWNSVEPGLGIAEFCNYAGLGGGDAFNFFRLPGASSSVPGITNRVARIDINGGYIQTSDKRLKSNFSPAPGLAIVLALQPQQYQHWECLGLSEDKKLKLGKNFTLKIGFLAQDVQKVLPEAVPATRSDDELYGIDYSCIVACLVRAVQEQQAQISALEARLTSPQV